MALKVKDVEKSADQGLGMKQTRISVESEDNGVRTAFIAERTKNQKIHNIIDL